MAVRAFDLSKTPHRKFKHKDVVVCEAIFPLGGGNFKIVWRRDTLVLPIIEVNDVPKPNPLVHKNFNIQHGGKISERAARRAVIVEFERVWELR